jgi:hypothetical protein
MAHSDRLPTEGRYAVRDRSGVGGGPVSRTPPRSGAACSEWCIAALSARWTRTDAVNVLTTNLEPDNVERFVREQVAMG